ncbi:MAG: hypothetical protein QXG22_00295 [Candidatus Hadarchaeales archaeon]
MRKEKRELLLRVIDLCESVRKHELDPFEVQVGEFLRRLRELLPKLKDLQDLYLDLQALLGLTEVILHQGEWIKHRSSLLYLDPLLISLKVQVMSNRDLAEIFVRAWHPIVELEILSPPALSEAKEYWTNLPPLEERRRELEGGGEGRGELSVEELSRMGIVSKEEFQRLLNELWEELKKVGGRGISYWKFISAPTFEETVRRAWLVSFLVSYGYAGMELKPLEDDMILFPYSSPQRREESMSLPVSISREKWRRKRGRGGRAEGEAG